jgi:hypothetical protein
MECPYCLEEVKEAAVVCRHCGRDLSAFKLIIAPTLEKVSDFEKRLSSLEKQLSSSETRVPDSSPSQAKQNTQEDAYGVEAVLEELHIGFWFSAFLCAVVPLIAYLLLAAVSAFWVSFFILMLPLAVGVEAGYYWSGRHWRDYLVAGAFVGLLAAFELWVVFNAEADGHPEWTKLDWAAGASGFAVASLFISGVLFGDIWEARAGPRTRSSAAASAAATLVHFDGKEPSQKMTMLIPLVEKLGPATIGVIGTLITTSLSLYFTRTIP